MSAEQFDEHVRRCAVGKSAYRRRRRVELDLLKLSAPDEAERIESKRRRQRTERQRFVRAQRKRPTWRQACLLLDRLEAQFVVVVVASVESIVAVKKLRRVDGSESRYGKILPLLVRQLIDELKLRRGVRFVDVGSGIGLVCLLIALVTGADVYGIEIRDDLHAIALQIAAEVKKECELHGWLGVGR
jgi:protein-L-isoaspartate O-methyltransferase